MTNIEISTRCVRCVFYIFLYASVVTAMLTFLFVYGLLSFFCKFTIWCDILRNLC